MYVFYVYVTINVSELFKCLFPFTTFESKSRNSSENRVKKCPKIWGPKIKSPKLLEVNVRFLLQDKRANGLLNFSKNSMFGKNVVLELWSTNITSR